MYIKDTGASVAAVAVRYGAELTVVDTSAEKDGKISACNTAIQLEGTLNLVSGTIAVDATPTNYDASAENGFAYAVWLYKRAEANKPVFNMTGGAIEIGEGRDSVPAEYICSVVAGNGVDGIDGTYTNAEVNISGGSIEGEVQLHADAPKGITGGTFTSDVSAFVASGKDLVGNGDGTFGVAPASEWTTDTDAGYYLNDANEKLGLMRFLFGIDTNETVKNFGIKYIKAANIGEDVNGENATGNEVSSTGDFKVFYGDIVNIPETYTEGTYYATGFVELESGEFKWSDIIECSLNWTRFFKDYKVGGAN